MQLILYGLMFLLVLSGGIWVRFGWMMGYDNKFLIKMIIVVDIIFVIVFLSIMLIRDLG